MDYRRPDTILAVLVVATPCPLILATPIAVLNGINHAARAGIISKGGTAIEQVGQVQAVIFDKTGTVTFGGPQVEQVIAFDSVPAPEMLRKAASVEQLSGHLLGRALVAAAQAEAGPLPLPAHFQEVPGRGVKGEVEGQRILVGSPRFLAERIGRGRSVTTSPQARRSPVGAWPHSSPSAPPPAGSSCSATSCAPVCQPSSPASAPSASGTPSCLPAIGARAQTVAAESGIDQVVAELRPQDKVTILESLKPRYFPIVMASTRCASPGKASSPAQPRRLPEARPGQKAYWTNYGFSLSAAASFPS